MYQCNECKHKFEEPMIIHYQEYPGASDLAEGYECPYCNGGNFDDIGDES